MLNTQRFARSSHLWPSSVFKHSPADGFQIFTVLSRLPLARSLPSKRHATVTTEWLPFSQMSGNTYVVVVYASPPLNLRLSPGEGGRHATLRKGGSPMSGEGVESQLFAKCGYLWPSSFLSTLPLSTSHSRIVLSLDPLTSCDGFVGLTAAIFSNVSFTGTTLRLSPPESTPLPR